MLQQKTKQPLRRALRCGVYLLVLILVLGFLQDVLCGATVTGRRKSFYSVPKNSVDLLVVGSSNMFCTVDPVQLYEQYGILAYDMGSSSQSLDISYLFLQEAFKRQKPKVVAVEVLKTYEDYADPAWDVGKSYYWGYPVMHFSPEKLQSVQALCERRQENPLDYLLPGVTQHTRWREVTGEDVRTALPGWRDATLGFTVLDGVEPIELQYETSTEPRQIPEFSQHWYREISRLCAENGAELVWFRAPFETWTIGQGEPIRQLAEEMGDDYLDMNAHIAEMGVDPGSDFYNMGHLNRAGAQKATAFLGQYVLDRWPLPTTHADGRDKLWQWAAAQKNKQ